MTVLALNPGKRSADICGNPRRRKAHLTLIRKLVLPDFQYFLMWARLAFRWETTGYAKAEERRGKGNGNLEEKVYMSMS